MNGEQIPSEELAKAQEFMTPKKEEWSKEREDLLIFEIENTVGATPEQMDKVKQVFLKEVFQYTDPEIEKAYLYRDRDGEGLVLHIDYIQPPSGGKHSETPMTQDEVAVDIKSFTQGESSPLAVNIPIR